MRTGDTGIRGLPNWVREDRLTGLASRYYFEDVLKRDFALAQRDKTDIALLLFDIDQLGPYNEIFDRAGGDAVIKRVARAIAASFRRGALRLARQPLGHRHRGEPDHEMHDPHDPVQVAGHEPLLLHAEQNDEDAPDDRERGGPWSTPNRHSGDRQ